MREKQHQRGLSAGYLESDRYDEEEEGEESISLAAIKSKYKGSGGLRGERGRPQPSTHEGFFPPDYISSGWILAEECKINTSPRISAAPTYLN